MIGNCSGSGLGDWDLNRGRAFGSGPFFVAEVSFDTHRKPEQLFWFVRSEFRQNQPHFFEPIYLMNTMA